MTATVGRAWRTAGPEREAVSVIVKSVIAGTVAWFLADSVFGATMPTFAPFSAVLMLHPTISQSLDQALRYSGAMVVGVVLAGATMPLGPYVPLFALVLLLALVVGRWRKLGSQGTQVAVAAVFAYGAFATSTSTHQAATQLPTIIGLVLLGCAIGVAVNVLIAPPLQYRNARYGVESLSASMTDLLSDIVSGLENGELDKETVRDWRSRADQLPGMASQTRQNVDHVAETAKFNPRRLLVRGGSHSFEGYRVVVNTLHRASEQLRSVTMGLDHAADREADHGSQIPFMDDYVSLLTAVRDATSTLGNLHETEDLRVGNEFGAAVQRCHEARDTLTEREYGRQLDDPSQWAVYGGLYTDGQRLVEEFTHARDDLDELVSAGGANQ